VAYITGITTGFAVSRVAVSGIADTSLFLYFMQWMSVCFRKKVLQRLNFISRAGLFLLCDHVASVILSLGDSTYWTGSLTCSTIDAGISINNICIFAFRNCTYRTFSFASTTLYTFIINYTCHGYVSSFFNFKTDNFRFVIYILIQESKIYKG
jgi:hypothetical protein